MHKSSPLIPMAAITGRPKHDDIYKTLKAYSDVGIKQFLIYGRSGCELDYMSEEWFNTCSDIIEIGHDMGFDIWLYDEFNWPSGTCNGKVQASNPDFTCKALDACIDGEKLNLRIYTRHDCADILNPEAIDLFIKLTHEQYANRFSSYLGNTIKGIFTDEPSQMYACYGNNPDNHLRAPYYSGIEEDYQKVTGFELYKDIEQYMINGEKENLWPTYFSLIAKRMDKVYFKSIRKWCDKHGLLFTGHLMDEIRPSLSICASGDPLISIKGFSLPGMDEIFTGTTLSHVEWVTLGTVHYGIKALNNGGMAELFALGPCDMPLAKMRQMIWLTSFFGVDRYLLAVAQLDARGNSIKADYFNPTSPMQTWFEAYKELGQDAAVAAEFASSTSAPCIQVRYPQSLAANLAPRGWKNSNNFDDIRFRELLELLVRKQYTWELISETDTMSSLSPAILNLTNSGIKEEKYGMTFSGLDSLCNWLNKNIDRDVQVENPDGSLAEDILIKICSDNTFAILDLTEYEGFRSLVLKMEGKSIPFTLYGRDVLKAGKNFKPVTLPSDKLAISNLKFKMKLDSCNLLRCVFTEECQEFKFELESDLKDIRLLLRWYSGEVQVTMDGSEISADIECMELQDGFRQLYKATAPFALDKGKHSLRLISKVIDYPYLPCAFISGGFSLSKDFILSALPESVCIGSLRTQGLQNYAGKLSLISDINVPLHAGRLYLKLDSYGLYTGVSINGEHIGNCAWAPFVWEIPDKCKGKTVKLEIQEATSIAGMFGGFKALKTKPESSWLIRYASGKNSECGLKEPLEWIFG